MPLRQLGGQASTNVQAGRDLIVYEGPSLEEIRETALDVFRENSIALRGIAEEVALARADKITNDFFEQLNLRAPDALNNAADPDMHQSLLNAQREFACSGEEDLELALVDLLVDRAEETGRGIRTLVLNEAIKSAPKLTLPQRRAIAVCFCVKYARPAIIRDGLEAIYTYYRTNLAPLVPDLPTKDAAFQHIEYVGAGAISMGSLMLGAALSSGSRPWFTGGFTPEEVPDPVRHLVDDARIFVPCLRDPQRLQLSFCEADDIPATMERLGIPPDLAGHFTYLDTVGVMPFDEVVGDLMANVPEVQGLAAWDASPLKQLTLTTVGIAIGHGYWRRVTGGKAPLSIWVDD